MKKRGAEVLLDEGEGAQQMAGYDRGFQKSQVAASSAEPMAGRGIRRIGQDLME